MRNKLFVTLVIVLSLTLFVFAVRNDCRFNEGIEKETIEKAISDSVMRTRLDNLETGMGIVIERLDTLHQSVGKFHEEEVGLVSVTQSTLMRIEKLQRQNQKSGK